jgi:hypothetical protein
VEDRASRQVDRVPGGRVEADRRQQDERHQGAVARARA